MNIKKQIKDYIERQIKTKRKDMQELHQSILKIAPSCQLWFLDRKNEEGKTVSNPNIGYGIHEIAYSNGSSRNFYKVGLSGNKTGISVYILGTKDKAYLSETYGKKIGKATITGYCIKFKRLEDINIEILKKAIQGSLKAKKGQEKIKNRLR